MGVLTGAALRWWKDRHTAAAWSLQPGWHADGLLLCKLRRIERCEMGAVVFGASLYQRTSRKYML